MVICTLATKEKAGMLPGKTRMSLLIFLTAWLLQIVAPIEIAAMPIKTSGEASRANQSSQELNKITPAFDMARSSNNLQTTGFPRTAGDLLAISLSAGLLLIAVGCGLKIVLDRQY